MAYEHGYLVSVSSSEGLFDVERRLVEYAAEQHLDGLIVAPILDDETDWAEVAELVTESYRFCAPQKLARQLDQSS